MSGIAGNIRCCCNSACLLAQVSQDRYTNSGDRSRKAEANAQPSANEDEAVPAHCPYKPLKSNVSIMGQDSNIQRTSSEWRYALVIYSFLTGRPRNQMSQSENTIDKDAREADKAGPHSLILSGCMNLASNLPHGEP